VEQPEVFKEEPAKTKRRTRRREPHEWQVTSLRECPVPESLIQIKCPDDAVQYWKLHIASAPSFHRDCEQAVVLILNTRLRIRGHHLVSIGTINETIANPREIFRVAVMASAHCIILMHNHPSGECEPSSADRRFTRRAREAGEVLGIALQDHIIVGHNRYFSFKEAGVL
jgi:DNA repair protein RadC